MKYIRKVFKALSHPRILAFFLLERYSYLIKNDAAYLKLMFWLKCRYKLNLEKPKTFNEKLNWLKIYYHNPILPII